MTQQFNDLNSALTDLSSTADTIVADVANLNTEITTLEAQIAAGGLTADEETQILASIAALKTKLAAILPTPTPAPQQQKKKP